MLEARTLITAWCKQYNREHYHGNLADLTPNEYYREYLKARRTHSIAPAHRRPSDKFIKSKTQENPQKGDTN